MTIIFTTLGDVVPIKKGGSDRLGEGSFSKVKLVSHRNNPNKLYAMKTITKKNEKERSLIFKEIKLHMSLNHPNIIKFEDYLEEKNEVYIFLEYAPNGDLFTQINRNKHSHSELLKFFYQTCLAIRYIHSKSIMHRDLKPENILMDENMNVKICDFGWSTEYFENVSRETLCGTFEYMAPEVILRQKQTKKTDIWALGILLYELFHGNAPFRGNRMDAILEQITQNRILFKKNVDPEIKDLIVKILKFYPQDRPTIEQIFEHPLMVGLSDSLTKSEDSTRKNPPNSAKNSFSNYFSDSKTNVSANSFGKLDKFINEASKVNSTKISDLNRQVNNADNFFDVVSNNSQKFANAFKKQQSPQPNTVIYETTKARVPLAEQPVHQIDMRININHQMFNSVSQNANQFQTRQKSPEPVKVNGTPPTQAYLKSPDPQTRAQNITIQPKIYTSLRNIAPMFQNYAANNKQLNTGSQSQEQGNYHPISNLSLNNMANRHNYSSNNLMTTTPTTSTFKHKSNHSSNNVVYKNLDSQMGSMRTIDLKSPAKPIFKPSSFVNHTLTSKSANSNSYLKAHKIDIGEKTFGNYLINISKS